MNNPKTRVLREVTPEQDQILRILDSVKYGTIKEIKYKDGKVRVIEVAYRFDLDHPETIQQTIDELKIIPFL